MIHCRIAGGNWSRSDGFGSSRSYRNVVTWQRAFSNVPECVSVTTELPELGHRDVDQQRINARQCADSSIAGLVFPREIWLSNLNWIRKGGVEGGGSAGVTITESLCARFQPPASGSSMLQSPKEETDSVWDSLAERRRLRSSAIEHSGRRWTLMTTQQEGRYFFRTGITVPPALMLPGTKHPHFSHIALSRTTSRNWRCSSLP